MRRARLLFATALAAGAVLAGQPGLAQEPIGGADFEAYTQGKVLYFGQGGAPYGVEEYLPGRRVRWSFLDGECIEGRWYAEGEAICFVYEDRPAPICWAFFLDGGGLSAQVLGDDGSDRLYETHEAEPPLQCRGPRVGV